MIIVGNIETTDLYFKVNIEYGIGNNIEETEFIENKK